MFDSGQAPGDPLGAGYRSERDLITREYVDFIDT